MVIVFQKWKRLTDQSYLIWLIIIDGWSKYNRDIHVIILQWKAILPIIFIKMFIATVQYKL